MALATGDNSVWVSESSDRKNEGSTETKRIVKRLEKEPDDDA